MSLRARQRAWLSAALGAIALLSAGQAALAGDGEAAPSSAPPAASTPAAPAPPTGAAAPVAAPAPKPPARPPPLPPIETKPLPWDHLLDVGGDFALVARPASRDRKGRSSLVRYEPATGFALHLRWPVFKYLQIEGYYLDVHLPVTLPPGALGLTDKITSLPVQTYVFGARVSPRITFGRVTAWVTAGAGWGRFEFRRMQATTAGGLSYALRERGGSFVEVPFGVGVSFEIIRRWLSFDVQATAAVTLEQHGDAFDDAQAVDPAGKLRNVGPMPIMDASLAQTFGLSLWL